MAVALISHQQIDAYLAADPCRNLFPRFVCRQRPDQWSLAFTQEGAVRGAVVSGADFGIVQVLAPWLVADSDRVAVALLAVLREHGRLDGLQLPWAYAHLVSEACPQARVTRDLYLARPAGAIPETHPDRALVRITAEVMTQIEVADELQRSIGNPALLPPGAPFWGLVVEGRMTAIAETIVRVDPYVSIQQVYSVTEARGQGHAKALVAQLLGHPEIAGTTVTWLASAANVASIGLALRLGFVEHCAFGCVEVGAEERSPAFGSLT
jgi:hypothetical protein